MPTVLHACVVTAPSEFLAFPPHLWAAQIVRLVLLQLLLSRHRKPLDAHELPLQHLLFRTGYLHRYIVNSGLGLLTLDPPRRSGGFGHDLHAIVQHPQLPRPLNLGVEVFMGAIGYHTHSIPEYVQNFQLQGLIVISKDDPARSLEGALSAYGIEAGNASRLLEMRIPLTPDRKPFPRTFRATLHHNARYEAGKLATPPVRAVTIEV